MAGVDQRRVLGLRRVQRLGWELFKVLGIQDLQGGTGTVSDVCCRKFSPAVQSANEAQLSPVNLALMPMRRAFY